MVVNQRTGNAALSGSSNAGVIGMDEIMGMAGASDPSALGQIGAGLGDIFSGLMGAGQSILSSPDALTGIAGGLLTKAAYDRLSGIGEQAKREAMGIAERGQAESQFRPFTVTTPTGAMFTARMGGQPARQLTMLDDRPIQPGGVLPPGMDEREAFRQGLLGQPADGLLLGPVITSQPLQPFTPRISGPMPAPKITDQPSMGLPPLTNTAVKPAGRMVGQPVGMGQAIQAPMVSSLPMTGQPVPTGYTDVIDMTPPPGAFQPQVPVAPAGEGLEIGMTLSPEEQALQRQLLGGAGGFFGQAMQPTVGREQTVFERIRAVQRPEEERQRLALEERLAAQGRLGTSSAAFGGATPELMAQQTAIGEARNRAMLSAMQQAQAEQAQQAALGGQFLGAGYLPQQQLIAALQPGLIQQELAQQAQQFGTGLFGETALSGIEAQLLAEQARANLLGGVGTNLITGLMNQQRAAAAQPSGGGASGLGGLFGDIVEDLGTVGSGIGRLLGIGG